MLVVLLFVVWKNCCYCEEMICSVLVVWLVFLCDCDYVVCDGEIVIVDSVIGCIVFGW